MGFLGVGGIEPVLKGLALEHNTSSEGRAGGSLAYRLVVGPCPAARVWTRYRYCIPATGPHPAMGRVSGPGAARPVSAGSSRAGSSRTVSETRASGASAAGPVSGPLRSVRTYTPAGRVAGRRQRPRPCSAGGGSVGRAAPVPARQGWTRPGRGRGTETRRVPGHAGSGTRPTHRPRRSRGGLPTLDFLISD